MKKIVIYLSFLSAIISINVTGVVKAQVLDGIFVKEHVPERKPIPYHHLREADMMWTKRVWRVIDMQQKINHPLYYPTQIEELSGRMSFINLILRAWRGDFANLSDNTNNRPLRLTLYAFDAFTDDFAQLSEATEKEVINNINPDAIDTLNVNNPNAPGSPMIDWSIVWRSTQQVKKLRIKEDWYFDKQRAKLEVRIVGICPIIERDDIDAQGNIIGKRPFPMFWIYFDELRPYLANHEVFNPYNDAERRTFDDIFFYRRFDSFIIQETNVFNDRTINTFKSGLDALLESERIKDWIFKVEHDLWEY
ncbi:MAG: gliding motility protein GldN [Bacteroidia bacterium]|nr:gliding motility protein GldN [Bacteroidia bacterium]